MGKGTDAITKLAEDGIVTLLDEHGRRLCVRCGRLPVISSQGTPFTDYDDVDGNSVCAWCLTEDEISAINRKRQRIGHEVALLRRLLRMGDRQLRSSFASVTGFQSVHDDPELRNAAWRALSGDGTKEVWLDLFDDPHGQTVYNFFSAWSHVACGVVPCYACIEWSEGRVDWQRCGFCWEEQTGGKKGSQIGADESEFPWRLVKNEWTTNQRVDPTAMYDLECGHTVMA